MGHVVVRVQDVGVVLQVTAVLAAVAAAWSLEPPLPAGPLDKMLAGLAVRPSLNLEVLRLL